MDYKVKMKRKLKPLISYRMLRSYLSCEYDQKTIIDAAVEVLKEVIEKKDARIKELEATLKVAKQYAFNRPEGGQQ